MPPEPPSAGSSGSAPVVARSDTPVMQTSECSRPVGLERDKRLSSSNGDLGDADEKDADLVEPPSPAPNSGSDGTSKPGFSLQDQTNLLPARQLLLVFSGLSMAMACSMLDQTA